MHRSRPFLRGEWVDLLACGRLWRLSSAQLATLAAFPLPEVTVSGEGIETPTALIRALALPDRGGGPPWILLVMLFINVVPVMDDCLPHSSPVALLIAPVWPGRHVRGAAHRGARDGVRPIAAGRAARQAGHCRLLEGVHIRIYLYRRI